MISYGLANNGIRRGVHMQDCVKNKPLRDFASTMNSLASFAFKEQYYTDKALAVLIDGLSHIAAYLFIPYGEEGLNYVQEKIHPVSIEEFLQKRAECLLEKTCILNKPEYEELVAATVEYCKNYSAKTLPFSPVSVVILTMRVESELIKHFMYMGLSTPESVLEENMKFLKYKLDYFRTLNESDFPTIDFDFHLTQVLKEHPQTGSFEFTEKHRQEIDCLPIFTFLNQL